MKIIGFLTAWACEDWIELTIQQALSIVDELIISIGAFHKYFNTIKDKTSERAKKYLNNKKVKFVQTICNPKNTPDQNKAATLNEMLKASENVDVGNILWIFDADEFYSKKAIEEIKKFIRNNDFDLIYVIDRMFVINFHYYILFKHERIMKIKNPKCFFTAVQNIHPTPKKIFTLLDKNPMFHYTLLMGEQIKGIQWALEGIPEAVLWYKKIYNYYDPNNEEYWMKKNQELTGHYGFWRNPNEVKPKKIQEKDGHGLFYYSENHPEIIESSKLIEKNDFRKYMKMKPNFKIYLKTMRLLISEEKRLTIKKIIKKYFITDTWPKRLIRLPVSLSKIKLYKNILKKIIKTKS